MTTRQPVVAIDGPAGSGKSTVAQRLARQAGLQFISSGAMYRAVALQALREGVPATERTRLEQIAATLPIRFATDADGAVRTSLDGEDVTDTLRTPEVAAVAAIIAKIPAVRAHLVARQRAYGEAGGIVMEGRDIQTVVFPDAEIKVYLDASAEERARRRWKEERTAGSNVSYASVLADVKARDAIDRERDVAPLRAAPDAITLNTDGLTIDQVVSKLLALVDAWRMHANRS
jgi:cytidylate kinase